MPPNADVRPRGGIEVRISCVSSLGERGDCDAISYAGTRSLVTMGVDDSYVAWFGVEPLQGTEA